MTEIQAPNSSSPGQPSIGEVRDNHRFDEARLTAWLKANLGGFSGDIEVSQFNRGASNPTFMITAASATASARCKAASVIVPGTTASTSSPWVIGRCASAQQPLMPSTPGTIAMGNRSRSRSNRYIEEP